MTERWGVLADDVTGACDVAAELHDIGLEVAVMLGVPHVDDIPDDVDAVVVGLGTRTAPRATAVAETLAAAEVLRKAGAGRWYQKYCSTFDSTDEGMIGPVAEVLLEASGLPRSVGTPATPHSDRTVYRGHLFVGDQLLSESPLAHHPLTPMTDSNLVRVLGRQSALPVHSVGLRTVRSGAGAIVDAIGRTGAGHILVDALDDDDLDAIAAALEAPGAEPGLPGGGAGLITALGRRLSAHGRPAASRSVEPEPSGAGIIISGSASSRSREQLAHIGGPTVPIDALAAAEDPDGVVAEAVRAIRSEFDAGRIPAVSAGHDAAALVAAEQALGTPRAAAVVERTLADIALAAVTQLGVRRLIVAGGETSGAVTRALGITALRLTRRVDPGVAWAVGRARAVPQEPLLAVLLKSGNFGGPDLLTRAWEPAS